ncbi:phage tail protein [Tumebacillus avium]|uniref:Phage tail protein n=1 Tax=Tumebacillus avium TaxID=1903704 RepID=A0A1Y0IJU6_9BACL|nr:tail fiber protein [Tumebacillus avium]ARU60747.1 phage tail protein [Tumebacillus avium]
MSESYLGEIRMFAGNFAPQGWALCNGQILSIAENEALFALLGTTYGGDGQTTFGLPNLQGRVAVHPSTTYPRGSMAGTENVTLLTNQMPAHTHTAMSYGTAGTIDTPSNNVWASRSLKTYATGDGQTTVDMNAQALSVVGGTQPHNNMMPTTTISFIISLYGVFPPQP